MKKQSQDNGTTTSILDHMDQGIALLDSRLKLVFSNRAFSNLTQENTKSTRLPAVLSKQVREYIKGLSKKREVYKISVQDHRTLYLTIKPYQEEEKQFYLLTLSKMRLREYDLFSVLNTEYNITPRHFQMIRFLAKGCTAAEIATFMNISQPTVKYHLSRLYDTFYVANRAELLGKIDEIAEQVSSK